MKYPKAMYIDSQIFGGDRDGSESNLTEKIVKIRTPHSCCICEKHIPKGEKMLNQKAIAEGQGWCSCYICIPCVENWLEESGQVEVGGTAYECRNCGDEVQKYLPYCPWCGQMQDWSDVDES